MFYLEVLYISGVQRDLVVNGILLVNNEISLNTTNIQYL